MTSSYQTLWFIVSDKNPAIDCYQQNASIFKTINPVMIFFSQSVDLTSNLLMCILKDKQKMLLFTCMSASGISLFLCHIFNSSQILREWDTALCLQ